METVVQGSNSLGEYVTLLLDKNQYDKDAIMKASYGLAEYYFVHITKATTEKLAISFYTKNSAGNTPIIENAVTQFLNALHHNQATPLLLAETH
ncbi:hypothetical protein [Mangrovibacter yixingensis]|uniref:hypothetical protein n=1 Tax=Mangrovibacter yixingensis TaxID=1529639 RepID=UPI001CFE5DD3|nr:hypothetical protein [Mangrovibacter yixingensis]